MAHCDNGQNGKPLLIALFIFLDSARCFKHRGDDALAFLAALFIRVFKDRDVVIGPGFHIGVGLGFAGAVDGMELPERVGDADASDGDRGAVAVAQCGVALLEGVLGVSAVGFNPLADDLADMLVADQLDAVGAEGRAEFFTIDIEALLGVHETIVGFLMESRPGRFAGSGRRP